jgi:hypothetical protein
MKEFRFEGRLTGVHPFQIVHGRHVFNSSTKGIGKSIGAAQIKPPPAPGGLIGFIGFPRLSIICSAIAGTASHAIIKSMRKTTDTTAGGVSSWK